MSGISMFGAVDPIYMVMLIKLLGPEYVVWDKEATIHFKNPGKTTLTARFLIETRGACLIRKSLTSEKSLIRKYRINLKDAGGEINNS
ncbi:MAG: DUF4442 domain-containing protein [Desulfobacterales bacterium]